MEPVIIPELSICNTGSVVNMVKRVGGKAIVLSRPEERYRRNKFILPGIGSFDRGMSELETNGWKDFLQDRGQPDAAPLLGICLGMQMLFDRSEEGVKAGLGLIPGSVVRFCQHSPPIRVPHMGWNEVDVVRDHPLLRRAEAGQRPRFYFVHSYHAVCDDPNDVIALVHYGSDVVASAGRGNIAGMQFHPEKSHRFGMALIKSFIDLQC